MFLTRRSEDATPSGGAPANKPLCAFFETRFTDFNNYQLSLDINRSFAIQGLAGMFNGEFKG